MVEQKTVQSPLQGPPLEQLGAAGVESLHAVMFEAGNVRAGGGVDRNQGLRGDLFETVGAAWSSWRQISACEIIKGRNCVGSSCRNSPIA
jgi:hypothetical protein